MNNTGDVCMCVRVLCMCCVYFVEGFEGGHDEGSDASWQAAVNLRHLNNREYIDHVHNKCHNTIKTHAKKRHRSAITKRTRKEKTHICGQKQEWGCAKVMWDRFRLIEHHDERHSRQVHTVTGHVWHHFRLTTHTTKKEYLHQEIGTACTYY